MTGVITDIKRFAVHDGDGIRTTLFLKGCPLKCVWCHNPESLSRRVQLGWYSHKCTGCAGCAAVCPAGVHSVSRGVHELDRNRCVGCGRCEAACFNGALKLYGKEMTADDIMPLLLEDRDFFETSGGGVTLSGGECLAQADFCLELLKKLKEAGINTAADTCGAVPRRAFEAVLPYTDRFLFDVKAVSAEVHKRCTGVDNGLILDNLRFLSAAGADIEIRIPLIVGFNDGEIPAVASLLSGLSGIGKVRVLKYHDLARGKYAALGLEDTMPPPQTDDDSVKAAVGLLCAAGLDAVYS